MHLAMTGCFKACWTNQIHDEWIEALLKKEPHREREKLNKVKELMNSHVYDAVIEGYESLIAGIKLPDPNDRHVLAAAIKGKCDVIVTKNLKDFPDKIIGQWGLEAQHPDEFIWHLLDLHPEIVVNCAKKQRSKLKNPEMEVTKFLDCLEAQGLVKTVSELRKYMDVI